MIEKFKTFTEVLRPFNCLMAAIAVWIGFIVSIKAFSFNFNLLVLMISAFLVCGAGQAVNDFFDLNVDRKIRKFKVLPSGRLMPVTVFVYSLLLFSLGILLGFFVGFTQFIIAFIFSCLLFVYSAFFTKLKYLGNWIVGLSSAFTLIYGASLSGNYFLVSFFAFSALLVSVGRELTKDLEDVKADAGFKLSLPMILDKKMVIVFVFFLYSIAIFNAFIAASLFNLNFIFLLFLTLTGGIFSFSGFFLSRNFIRKSHLFSKIGMFLALITFLLSVI